MADIYTPPSDSAYLLNTPFAMPSNTRDRWAVSFSGNDTVLVAAALSVAVTFSFLCLWNLISFLGMFFHGNSDRRRRYVALVTLWNSNDPWFAFKEFLHYTFCAIPHHHKDWSDFRYGLVFSLISLGVFAGSIAMGIVAPSLVQIGNVAPVRQTSVFYPSIPNDPVQQLQDFGLRAPSVMRSLGSVEAAEVTLRRRVSIKQEQNYAARSDNDRVVGLSYSYSLSGVDLGLQKGFQLALAVDGYCQTEYGWTVDPPEDLRDLEDRYQLWGNKSESFSVNVNQYDIQNAPSASFRLHPNIVQQLFKDSNMSFAVIVSSARRTSITQGGDPWYATEARNTTDARYGAEFWMKRRRPALSCWEQDRWSYGSRRVDSVFDLKNVPGIEIPLVLLEVLQTTFGGGPMIVRLGNASGDSALRSRTTSPNGVINAQASSMYGDMERLILASFVATRSMFTDATMFGQPKDYDNLMTGPDKQPRDGAGNFVISSPDIQTFSLTGIVTLATILLALLLANTLAWLVARFHAERGHGQAGVSTWTLLHVLKAVHIFRCLYEPDDQAASESNKWPCHKSIPHDDDDVILFKLTRVPGDKNPRCKGHIDKSARAGVDRHGAGDAAGDETVQHQSVSPDMKSG